VAVMDVSGFLGAVPDLLPGVRVPVGAAIGREPDQRCESGVAASERYPVEGMWRSTRNAHDRWNGGLRAGSQSFVTVWDAMTRDARFLCDSFRPHLAHRSAQAEARHNRCQVEPKRHRVGGSRLK
jgi:hypothetical protein